MNIFRSVIFYIVISICMSAGASAQVHTSTKRLGAKAHKLYEEGHLDQALELYLKADSLHPNDAAIHYGIGLCYAHKNEYFTTLPYFRTAKYKGHFSPELDYHYGKALHQNHMFEEALAEFTICKGKLHHADRKHKDLDRLIEHCRNGAILIKTPVEVTITNLGPNINSKFADFSPAINADETMLVFTSRRENTIGGHLDPNDNLYFEDIYIAKKENGVWNVTQGSKDINSEEHDACAGLSADGQEMIIYRSAGNTNGDLFMSQQVGQTWSPPKKLGPNINSKEWEPSASLSADGKVMFFASNRTSGFGGTDIYMSTKNEKGEFGPPIHLGPEVNTPDDENSPFIHHDGKTLYYSSNGHKSIGGFDIFSTTINLHSGQITSAAQNIGYPINTAHDDVFFVWSIDGKRAYFSSVRQDGLGEKDIYMLERE
ncbi:MAG TPA: tetratricopeptide repeat protein [Cytophagaceae bacterium]|jgi:hypothetical protein